MLLRIALICLLALFAQGAGAVPSISNVSGTLSHGNAVTISGSGFLTKSTAAPSVWDTFEDGVCNTSATIGAWASTEWTCTQQGTVASTDNRHARSTWHVSKNMFGTWPEGANAYFTEDPTAQYWFAQFWFKADETFAFSGDMGSSLGNVKIFRMWPSGSGDNFVVAIHWGSSIISLAENCGNTLYAYDLPIVMSLDNGQWHQLQFQYKDSTSSGSTDGAFKMWIDGTVIQDRVNIGTKCAGSDSKYLFILGLFDSDSTGNDGTNYAYYDDMYADRTWSRVELCTGSTWAAKGQCEIQPPTAWATGSISVTFNQGAFATAATAYAYVIDSAGAVNSSGFPVTIGGAPSNPPVLSAVSCSPTSVQSVGTSTCTATISGGTPTTYEWTIATSGTLCAPSGTNPVTYTCQYGGSYQPCLTVSNTDGSSGPVCATQALSVRYRQPTGFGAN